MNDDWLTGFFEGQASFSVNIGLNKSKNKRYVVFKPYIVIASVDKYQVEHIINIFKLKSTVSKKKKKESYHSDYHSLNIQNFEDIEKILNKIKGFDFISKIKRDKVEKFIDCYNDIVELGHIHSKWEDDFENIIDKKLIINQVRSNINKNRFSKKVWVDKIREHLESE